MSLNITLCNGGIGMLCYSIEALDLKKAKKKLLGIVQVFSRRSFFELGSSSSSEPASFA